MKNDADDIEKFLAKKISQANDFIESPFSQEFTAGELKIFEGSTAQCLLADMELFNLERNKKIKFTTNQLAKLLNTSVSVVSHEAERMAKSLVTKHIHTRKLLDDDQVEFVTVAIVPYASYINGIFELELNYKLIPYFIAVDRPYTQFYLHNISPLKSAYAIKLYKLLYQYKNIKVRKFFIDELREQFGMSSEKYIRYNDFKQNALILPIAQINKFTDLTVEYKEVKFGRKVTKLEFYFKLKSIEKKSKALEQPLCLNKIQPFEIIDAEVIPEFSQIDQLLGSYKDEVTTKTKEFISGIIATHGVVFIECSIAYAIRNAKTNFEKYLIDTIQNNWVELNMQKSLMQKVSANQKRTQEQERKEKINKERAQEMANRSEIEHLYCKLTDDEQKNYINLATHIYRKNKSRLSNLSSVSIDLLTLSVFAVSNNRYYNRGIELLLTSSWGISLSINDYL